MVLLLLLEEEEEEGVPHKVAGVTVPMIKMSQTLFVL
jgi:hypothetical protein